MAQPEFDFYDKTSLKSYNLDKSMRYQLDMLDTLDLLNIALFVHIYMILENFLYLHLYCKSQVN